LTKIGWATIRAILSLTQLVTLPGQPTFFYSKKLFFFFVEHWFPRKGKRALRTDLVQSRRFAEKN
jgi:hypothetical protein